MCHTAMTPTTRRWATTTMTEPPPLLSLVLPAHNELGLLGSTVTNLTTGLVERGLD